MNDPKIPSYPVVHVTVHSDGSAHVNAAGDHRNYPAGDLDNTRAQVRAYAVAVATRLGRGVRMSTTDPDGEWKLAVYPDGEVVDLAPAPAKGRATAKTNPAQQRTVAVAVSVPPTATKEPTTITVGRTTEPEVSPVTRDAGPTAGTPVATLTFSTCDTAIIGPPAIIGRNPSSIPDLGGAQLVVVSDRSRTVSRVHADVAWVDGKLIVRDLGAGNGTAITRTGAGRFELTPRVPWQLLDGDLLHVGSDVTCRVAIRHVPDPATR